MISSGESGNQHHQSAFRQVEIGYEALHGLEGVTGIDEDLGPLGLRFKAAIFIYKALQGAAGSGAHTDDTPASGFRPVENIRSFLKFMMKEL